MNSINAIKIRRPIYWVAASAVFAAVTSSCAPGIRSHPSDLPPETGFAGPPEYNSDDFAEYINRRLAWQGRSYDVYLQCSPGECQATGGKVHLLATLHRDTRSVNPIDAIDPLKSGHVVARLDNLTDAPVKEYGLTRKGDVVFLWVGKTGTDRPAFALYKFDKGQVKRVAYATKGFWCASPGSIDPPVHAVDPNYCDNKQIIYDYSSSKRTSITPATILRLATDERRTPAAATQYMGEGLWFSCSLGCCQADFSFY